MKKYRIGLIVIALLILGLTGYTLYIGNKGKQDIATEKRAQEIANELNNYVEGESKIPENLDAANIKNVPSTIKYEKLSEEKYRFCVTYVNEKGYGSGGYGVTDVITRGLYGGMSYPYDYDYSSDYESTYLYLSYVHNKGENCQTVKPSLFNLDPYYDAEPTSQDDSSSIYADDQYLRDYYCTGDMLETYADYCAGLETEAL